ncbi:hypothetical protein MSG28_014257 [Choristoneura fumiferana]|uniref:Uncharacterized protein n=1 Tax=Choristoneura fumiferana TaxID=7141 RepID=A0ACC0JGK4_CHOFU|nr:hypothetical protein MSG28_014257 [Choristoneura fumiferana]
MRMMLSLPILKEIKDVNVTDRPIPDDLERHKKRLRQRWKCNMHAGLLTMSSKTKEDAVEKESGENT